MAIGRILRDGTNTTVDLTTPGYVEIDATGGGGEGLPVGTEDALAWYVEYTAIGAARPDWDGPVIWVDVNNVGAPTNWVNGDYRQGPDGAATHLVEGSLATLLGSGAATDGYVLTADGAGGVAWEVVDVGTSFSLPIDATPLAAGDDIVTADNAAIEITAGGEFRIVSLAANAVPLVIRGATGQTSPLTEWRADDDTLLGRFTPGRVMDVVMTPYAEHGFRVISAGGFSFIEMLGGTATTAHLKTDDGNGNGILVAAHQVPLRWKGASSAQTTVGAAGAASALPATPSQYLKVMDPAGNTLVVPAYAAS